MEYQGNFVFDNKIIENKRTYENIIFGDLLDEKYESFYMDPYFTNEKRAMYRSYCNLFKGYKRITKELNDIALIYSRKIEREMRRMELEEENHRIRAQLQELSITDTLTSLYNRRYFSKISSDILHK